MMTVVYVDFLRPQILLIHCKLSKREVSQEKL
jgi:hypothetical protein